MKCATITLDWRFEALCRFSEARIQGLLDFHHHMKKYTKKAIRDWKKECESVTDDDSARAEYLAEQRNQIEYILETGHKLGILGLYAFLENHLNLVIEHLRKGKAKIKDPGARGFNLHEIRDNLRTVGIDIEKAPFQFHELDRLRVIRNCIAHTDGWITEEFAKKLDKVGQKEKIDTQLALPVTDFKCWWKLVNKQIHLINEECYERFFNPDLP